MGKFSQILTPKWFYTIVNFWVIWLKTVDFIKDLEWDMFFWTRGMCFCVLVLLIFTVTFIYWTAP